MYCQPVEEMISKQYSLIMRNELKRYSSIGNKAGILLLCRKLLTGSTESIESVRTSCSFISGVDLNFNCGLLALEALGLIRISGNQCISQEIVFSSFSEDEFSYTICRKCFHLLIDNDLIAINAIRYSEADNSFILPTSAFNFSFSVFRNLLITFGALVSHGASFLLAEQYEDFFNYLVKHKQITQEQLLKKLEKQTEIGTAGELFVLDFERRRCRFSVSQINSIKRISVIDVNAGYDIVSFENESTNERRFIEVKTYVGSPHFHWSKNEMEVAKLRTMKYYLYLVDYSKIHIPGYSPFIFRDPYNTIRFSEDWIQEIDSIQFNKIT